MKKWMAIFVLIGLLSLSGGCASAVAQPIRVVLDGQAISFDVEPQMVQDRVMVPMRTIFESLGMNVSWEETFQTITAVKKKNVISMQVGSTVVTKNGTELENDAAPIVVGGRTLVPIRILGESLGLTVSWDEETAQVTLSSQEKTSDDTWKSNTGAIDLDQLQVTGRGVSVQDGDIQILQGGDFEVTGTLENGMIQVNTDQRVKLRLSGVEITNDNGPAIFFENADKALITVTEGTTNVLTDGVAYEADAKAALFSNDDLEIKGEGTLVVNGNFKHGIASDDEIVIENGNIIINAVQDGMHANDGIQITGGVVTITADGDGIQSEKYTLITGGRLDITTKGEVEAGNQNDPLGGFPGGRPGMGGGPNESNGNPPPEFPSEEGQMEPPQNGGQRPLPFLQEGGAAGGEMSPPASETGTSAAGTSSKGIKAETYLLMTGGEMTVNTTDHAIHSADLIVIDGGTISLNSSAGKGISGHGNVFINGGNIDIQNSTEGLESKKILTVNGGNLSIISSDDGINTGGTEGGMGRPGMQGGDNAQVKEHTLYLNGGTLYIYAQGDGIDSNGFMYIRGGTIVVHGPTANMDGALDTDYGCVMTGGFLVAVGSAGMAVAPNGDSAQNALHYRYSMAQEAGALISIQEESGNTILAFQPEKAYQSLVFSSPELESGKTYSIFSGGTCSGEVQSGLYQGGEIEGATLVDTFTVSGTITTQGVQNSGMGGRPGRNNGGMQGQQTGQAQ